VDGSRNAPAVSCEGISDSDHSLKLTSIPAASLFVRNIAEAIGAKPSQVALAWLLGKGDFIVPIPGTKRCVYLEENAGAVDVELSDVNMARLEAALRPEAVSGPRYNEKLMAWVDR
jgi:aryl-alcohol dehydrogenase-like predicted oxidoreductase